MLDCRTFIKDENDIMIPTPQDEYEICILKAQKVNKEKQRFPSLTS